MQLKKGSSGFRVPGRSFSSLRVETFFPRARRFAVFRAGESAYFPGFMNCCKTTLVLTHGNSGVFENGLWGSAIFSRVTGVFGSSFCRTSYGHPNLAIQHALDFSSLFAR
jgi:hypothetical protein